LIQSFKTTDLQQSGIVWWTLGKYSNQRPRVEAGHELTGGNQTYSGD